MDLVKKLDDRGFRLEDIDGVDAWVQNMMDHAQASDAFIFPPMTSLDKNHPRYQAEAAKRWFEFFSVVTGVHVGSKEKYSKAGTAKPCVVMDPDGQWKLATDLLEDLKEKGMFSSKVDDIVHVVGRNTAVHDYAGRNNEAVTALQQVIADNRGKAQKEVPRKYPDRIFQPQRKPLKRHKFGVAMFGSATTTEDSYIAQTEDLAQMVGQRGWRMSTGAGNDGCMGAMDRGFDKGKKEFNQKYPNAKYKPAHIGVSTNPILQLEGNPEGLEQLIITDNIYDRMEIMLRGNKSPDPLQRADDATKVIFVVPGGAGTLHEFATMMQLATNGNMMEEKTVVLLNIPNHLNPDQGFWDKLIETAKELGFDKHFEVANTPQEAIDIADREYKKWLERHPDNKTLPHPQFNPNPRATRNERLASER
ncbi:MAG: LOG family protein [Alphaproteobacteria bacterium]